jgi:predicted glycosyltransferase involved in capsule biosynthesis
LNIGVLFLDADVLISCDDLKFMHSVWKSSQISAIGLFPRLVNEKQQTLSKTNVIWQREYNLLLSSGIMVHRVYSEVTTAKPLFFSCIF